MNLPSDSDRQTAMTPADGPLTGLVLGTMTFGDTVSPEVAGHMVDVAIDAGITHIDTANGYAGGRTEEILAGLIADRRENVFLASKAGMPHPDAGDEPPLSPSALRRSVEGSLRRLGTDYLDLFYLHQPDYNTPITETLEAVAELAAEGKIRALGTSNFAAWQVGDLIRAARDVGAPEPVVSQQLYNLVARRLEDEYLPFATAHGVMTMAYNPLGGGLLTGRHSYAQHPEHGRFGDSRLAQMYTDRYWNEQLFSAIDRLSEIANDAEITLIDLSLRWLAHRPQVDSLLLGGSKPEQLIANISAIAKGPLAEDVVAACDEVGADLRGPMPAYNR